MSDLPKGLFAKKPHQNAPQWIKSKLSVKRNDFIEYLQSFPDEWLNFDITESKDGQKFIVKRDEWKPSPSTERKEDVVGYGNKIDSIKDEEIPF